MMLNFRFKGARNYIHGSDIFDTLEAAFKDAGLHVTELVFRNFSRYHLTVLFETPDTKVVCEGVAISAEGLRKPFWVVETDLPVVERYDFDENLIAEAVHISGDTIEHRCVVGFSVMEQIIAITKILNYTKSPNVDGRWVFGQLRLKKALPSNVEYYRIKQRAMLSNRFSVQDIYLDNDDFGEIRFIVGSP